MAGEHTVVEGRPTAKRSNRPLLVAIVALLLLAVLGILLAKLFRGRPITEATAPPSISAPNITTGVKPDMPAAAVITEAPKPEPAKPTLPVQAPQEVKDYLAFLKGVELYRQQMKTNIEKQLMNEISNNKDLNPILKLLDDPEHANLDDQAKEAQTINSESVKTWMKFLNWFEAKTPPEECKPISNPYRAGVQGIVNSISSVQEALKNLDLSQLKEMQGQSVDVDKQYSTANDELNKLRSKYNLPNDFEIKSEKNTSPLFGF